MLKIEHVLVSDEVWETRFGCDVTACKGACCRIGNLGAPIAECEESRILELLPEITPMLPRRHARFLEAGIGDTYRGERHIREIEPNHPCPLGFIDSQGILSCSLHKYALDRSLPLATIKPIWCLSYPLIISKSSEGLNINLSIQPHCHGRKGAGPILIEFADVLEATLGKQWMSGVRRMFE
ncbi:MAG: DUF3109 family protein [Candidatus Riflebacteria bacterium]|nr:DUF3109 family protein [Candidatus Riflebacteria bacterium]